MWSNICFRAFISLTLLPPPTSDNETAIRVPFRVSGVERRRRQHTIVAVRHKDGEEWRGEKIIEKIAKNSWLPVCLESISPP